MTLSMEERVTRIEDMWAISNWMSQYCHFADKRDWQAFADLFTDDYVMDIGEFGVVKGKAAAVAELPVKNAPFTWFFHTGLNPWIEVNGNQASARWYLFVPLDVKTGDGFKGGAGWLFGTYEGKFIKTPQGWKGTYWKEDFSVMADHHKGWHDEKLQFASMLGFEG